MKHTTFTHGAAHAAQKRQLNTAHVRKRVVAVRLKLRGWQALAEAGFLPQRFAADVDIPKLDQLVTSAEGLLASWRTKRQTAQHQHSKSQELSQFQLDKLRAEEKKVTASLKERQKEEVAQLRERHAQERAEAKEHYRSQKEQLMLDMRKAKAEAAALPQMRELMAMHRALSPQEGVLEGLLEASFPGREYRSFRRLVATGNVEQIMAQANALFGKPAKRCARRSA